MPDSTPDAGGHTPRVSAEDVERIRRWHEDQVVTRQSVQQPAQTFAYLGTSLVVPPEVQPITGMSHLLGEAVLAEVRRSDVFSHVDGRFDLIVFDPPFRWFAPRDLRETATTDHGYRAMTAFFRQARRHLAQGGRMLVFFGTSGDLPYLRHLADEEGFTTEVLAHERLVKDGWRVDYYTFRMT